MKTTLKTVLALSFVVLFAACSNNQQPEDSHAGHDHGPAAKAEAPATPSATASATLKDKNLGAVYQQYQQLTSSLTAGNADEAKVAAFALEAGAKEIQGGSPLATIAAKITNAADLETQRTIFATLSDQLISLLKESGLESGELYIAHCPMALNDKGAQWVSNSKEIRNPYYGESMLTCGSVKETLN